MLNVQRLHSVYKRMGSDRREAATEARVCSDESELWEWDIGRCL